MPFAKIEDIKNLRQPKSRLLGLDVGEKTIGLSISNSALTLATPLETIKRTKFTKDIEILKTLIDEKTVGGLVVGYPLNMDGTEGPRCQSTRSFCNNVLQHVDLPLALWDERLSTKAMERHLIEQDVSRAKRSKAIDALAATWILQGALESMA